MTSPRAVPLQLGEWRGAALPVALCPIVARAVQELMARHGLAGDARLSQIVGTLLAASEAETSVATSDSGTSEVIETPGPALFAHEECTVAEAKDVIGVGRREVTRLISVGRLTSLRKVGLAHVLDREQVAEYARNRRRSA